MAIVTRTGAARRVNDVFPGDQGQSSVASLVGGGFVIAWTDNGPAGPSIESQLYDASGVAFGQVQVAAGAEAYSGSPGYGAPNVTGLENGGYAITWSQTSATHPFEDIYARSYAENGSPAGSVAVATLPVTQATPHISGLAFGGYVVTWTQNNPGEILSRRFNDTSGQVIAEQRVNTTTAGGQYDASSTDLFDGGHVVAWVSSEQDGSSNGIFFQRYSSFSAQQGVETQVNTQFVGDQSAPDVDVLSDGSFVVAWQSASPNDTGYDIRAQHFNATGARIGGEFRVNSTLAGTQSQPQITGLADGGFVILWTSDGANTGVFLQRYDSAGAIVGGEIKLSGYAPGEVQSQPSIAALDDGGFIVTWTEDRVRGDIFSRTFEAPVTTSATITAAFAAEIIEGTDANEIIRAAPGTFRFGDQIYGGGGTDRLQLTAAGTLDLTAPDVFRGVEQIVGSAGNDTFIVSTERLADVTLVALGGGTNIFQAVGSFTLKDGLAVANIAAADPAGTEAYSYTGNAFGQTITGNNGGNVIRGLGGNDTLTGRGGNDVLYGGEGNDVFYVETNSDSARELNGEGVDTVFAATTFGLLAGSEIETLRTQNDAGTLDIELRGNEFAQSLIGNEGDNAIDGRAGADTLRGLGGDDVYSVDNLGDRVFEATNGGLDTVRSSVTFTLSANVETLILTGAEQVNGTGNTLANAITGNAANNRLDGGAGVDVMTGGDGDDVYFVDQTADKAVELAGQGTDLVYASVSFNLGADVENLTLTGTAAANGKGNALANYITGNAGANVLTGNGGADRLAGGAGDDIFSFSAPVAAANIVRILDYAVADDTIYLDDAVFAGLPRGSLTSAAFYVGQAAHDADDRVIYNSALGRLYFDLDGSGAQVAQQFAILSTGLAMTESDFKIF